MRKLMIITGIISSCLWNSSRAIERITPIQEPDESTAKPITREAKQKKSLKPWLGVAGQPIDKKMAERLDLSHGVAVELVSPNGSAAQAGIKKFDVITEINGEQIASMGALKNVLSKAKVGDDIEITCMSSGNLQKRKVTLQPRPSHLAQHQRSQIDLDNTPTPSADSTPMPEALRNLSSHDQQRIRQMMQARSEEMEKRMAQIQQQFLQNSQSNKPMDQGTHGSISSSFSLMDDQGSVHVKSDGENGKHITVKDRKGKIVFSGPYESEADQNAVPEGVRQRIDALGLDNGTAGMNSFFPFGR